MPVPRRPSPVHTLALRLGREDDGRLQLICLRPAGPFAAFDRRLSSLAERLVRVVRVRIVRQWDAPAHLGLDLGFVSATVPTVLVVRDGRVVAKCLGDVPERELVQVLGEQDLQAA